MSNLTTINTSVPTSIALSRYDEKTDTVVYSFVDSTLAAEHLLRIREFPRTISSDGLVAKKQTATVSQEVIDADGKRRVETQSISISVNSKIPDATRKENLLALAQLVIDNVDDFVAGNKVG